MIDHHRTTPLRAAQSSPTRSGARRAITGPTLAHDDFEQAQVDAAAAYLRALTARPNALRFGHRAGTLKASAERWAGFYIGATALVAAARRVGVRVKGLAFVPEQAVEQLLWVPDPDEFASEQFDRQRRSTTRTSELFWPDWNAPRWRKVSGEWLLIH